MPDIIFQFGKKVYKQWKNETIFSTLQIQT